MSASESMSLAALTAAADRAAAGGAVADARGYLERAVRLAPGDLSLWMNLAACCRGVGDLPAALAAADGALAVDPRSFVALLMKASLLERMGAPHEAGAAYGIALTQAPPLDQLLPPMRAATKRARDVHARYEAALGRALKDSLGELTAGGGPAARRLDAFIDHLAGRRRVYHQEPVQFHYPGLPEIEFHDRDDFPWIEAFEAATPAIQDGSRAASRRKRTQDSVVGRPRPAFTAAISAPLASAKRRTISRCERVSSVSSW